MLDLIASGSDSADPSLSVIDAAIWDIQKGDTLAEEGKRKLAADKRRDDRSMVPSGT